MTDSVCSPPTRSWGGADAHAATRIDRSAARLYTPLQHACMASGPSLCGRGSLGSESTSGDGGPARPGAGAGAMLPPRSSRVAPCRVDPPRRFPRAAVVVGAQPGPERPPPAGCGSPPGAPPRRHDPGPGGVPGCRALGPPPSGQGHRTARVGLTVLPRVGPLRAVPSRTQPTASEVDGWGAAEAPGGAALGAGARAGDRRREPRCREHAAVASAAVGPAPRVHHARASGGGPRCARPPGRSA
jgi:hypothetical protein